jgi:hydrogenase-1 operon protein HyaE
MTSPLIQRLTTELNWPHLANGSDLSEYLGRPGVHCLFAPGDPVRNLETNDAAVVLPELKMAFQNAFDCAVVDDAIEAAVRETYRALKTPAFIFVRDGVLLGSIQKVRDWDDYLARVQQILSSKAA